MRSRGSPRREPGLQPAACRRGVGERFLRRERLRDDDEQRRCRVEAVQGAGQVFRVDVGDEAYAGRVLAGRENGTQRVADQPRAEVGAADADVHHVADRPPGGARAPSVAQCAGERGDARLSGADRRQHVAAIDVDRSVVLLAQRHVQRRSPLGLVDLLAGKERGNPGRQIGGLGFAQQRSDDVAGHPFLGEIDQPAIPVEGQPGKSLRVSGEQAEQRRRAQGVAQCFQRGRGFLEGGHVGAFRSSGAVRGAGGCSAA
jgi:hypothetical protein